MYQIVLFATTLNELVSTFQPPDTSPVSMVKMLNNRGA